MSWLQSVDQSLLFSRNDKEDPRLGECVTLISNSDLESPQWDNYDFAVIGWPDDEGISLNGGRVGARQAPKEIRTSLYKMTPHLDAPRLPRLLDIGDLSNQQSPLSERHEKGRELVRTLSTRKLKWISLGGGHDYGYADACGFLDVYKGQAVILNFDAHLDVRPTNKGLNSGTPFFRMLNEFSNLVEFAEVGIQSQCNSRAHAAWATGKGAKLLTLEQVSQYSLLKSVQDFMNGKEGKKVFLSIDIDAFTSSEAPGCSQSWTTGLKTEHFLNCLSWLLKNFDVRGLGIYEVSPPLDQDNRTSKLAALIAHHFIFGSLKKEK